MADTLKKTAQAAPEGAPERSSSVSRPEGREAAPRQLREGRGEIARTLEQGEATEGQDEMMESGEIREASAEGSERTGDPARQRKKGGGGRGQKAGQTGTFIFDEKNLPPVPEMIARIEQHLRDEIRSLRGRERRYRGGMFRKTDYPKYSETIIELRNKHVLLRRIAHMAAELIKSLFLQLFGGKKAS